MSIGTTPAAREQMMISAAIALRASLQSAAEAKGFGRIPEGQLDRVVANAQGLFQTLSDRQLASAAVNPDLLASLSSLSLGAVYGGMSPEQVRALNAQRANQSDASAGVTGDAAQSANNLLRFAALRDPSAGSEGAARGGGSYGGLPSGSSTQWNPSSGIGAVTAQNFASTPFAAAGLTFGTFQYVAANVPGASVQNIINGATDARTLGFNGNRRVDAAMTTLDRDDPQNRRQNMRVLQDNDRRLRGDAELRDLATQLRAADGDADRQRQIREQIAARIRHIEDGSGLTAQAQSRPTAAAGNAVRTVGGEQANRQLMNLGVSAEQRRLISQRLGRDPDGNTPQAGAPAHSENIRPDNNTRLLSAEQRQGEQRREGQIVDQTQAETVRGDLERAILTTLSSQQSLFARQRAANNQREAAAPNQATAPAQSQAETTLAPQPAVAQTETTQTPVRPTQTAAAPAPPPAPRPGA